MSADLLFESRFRFDAVGLVLVPTEGDPGSLLAPECGVSPPILMRVAGLWRTPQRAAMGAQLVGSAPDMHGLALAHDRRMVFPGIDRAARAWFRAQGIDLTEQQVAYTTKAEGIARRCVEAGLARCFAIDVDGRGFEVEVPLE